MHSRVVDTHQKYYLPESQFSAWVKGKDLVLVTPSQLSMANVFDTS